MISIIITNHDREKYLTRCLFHLSRQRFKDFEVILVDDNFEPEIPEPQSFPITVLVLGRKKRQNEYLNNAIGINLAVQYAKGDYLIFTDPEVYSPCNLVEEHLKHTTDGGITLGGAFWTEIEDEEYVEKQWMNLDFMLGYMTAHGRHFGTMFMNAGCSKETWEKIGGMDETLSGWGAQDIRFFQRCEQLGIPFIRLDAPAIHQYHPRNYTYIQGKLRPINLTIFEIPIKAGLNVVA